MLIHVVGLQWVRLPSLALPTRTMLFNQKRATWYKRDRQLSQLWQPFSVFLTLQVLLSCSRSRRRITAVSTTFLFPAMHRLQQNAENQGRIPQAFHGPAEQWQDKTSVLEPRRTSNRPSPYCCTCLRTDWLDHHPSWHTHFCIQLICPSSAHTCSW